MKFGQFMSYYKRKKNYQNFLQKLPPENSFQALLVFAKNKAQCPKLLKQATYICISKTIRIYPNKLRKNGSFANKTFFGLTALFTFILLTLQINK